MIPLVKKSDAADALKNSITASESFFSPLNLKVAAVMSDNGGEFCNANSKSYFMCKGIAHRSQFPTVHRKMVPSTEFRGSPVLHCINLGFPPSFEPMPW